MTDVGLDTCLKLVSDRQRRCVLQPVRNRPTESVAFDTLVEAVAHAERDSEAETDPKDGQIAVQLSHSHLPQLADHGIIDYDRDSGTIRYESDERIESLLDSLSEETASVSVSSTT